MAITAKDVQTLREMTGVGMMDCKKALTEAEGNMDKALRSSARRVWPPLRKRRAASPPRAWPMPPW